MNGDTYRAAVEGIVRVARIDCMGHGAAAFCAAVRHGLNVAGQDTQGAIPWLRRVGKSLAPTPRPLLGSGLYASGPERLTVAGRAVLAILDGKAPGPPSDEPHPFADQLEREPRDSHRKPEGYQNDAGINRTADSRPRITLIDPYGHPYKVAKPRPQPSTGMRSALLGPQHEPGPDSPCAHQRPDNDESPGSPG